MLVLFCFAARAVAEYYLQASPILWSSLREFSIVAVNYVDSRPIQVDDSGSIHRFEWLVNCCVTVTANIFKMIHGSIQIHLMASKSGEKVELSSELTA
jgi:hypothetical protein